MGWTGWTTVDHARWERRLREFVAAGWTQAEIAHAVGKPLSTIGGYCRRYGIAPAREVKQRRHFLRDYGPQALTRLEQLLRADASYTAIGAEFGVSRERVRQWKEMFFPHLPRRAPGRQAHTRVAVVFTYPRQRVPPSDAAD